jgi:hypothetical protein
MREESMAVYRKHVDWEGMGMGLRALGDLFLEQADVSAARRVFAESLTLARQIGDKLDLARSLEGLVGVWVEAQPDRSVRLAGAATALRQASAVARLSPPIARRCCSASPSK